MTDRIAYTRDQAVDMANGYPEKEEWESKIVDIEREKYHMRQLVLSKLDGKWYGFEFFDPLDKHGESMIGDNYIEGDYVYAYPVHENIVTTFDYKFEDRDWETYA